MEINVQGANSGIVNEYRWEMDKPSLDCNDSPYACHSQWHKLHRLS